MRKYYGAAKHRQGSSTDVLYDLVFLKPKSSSIYAYSMRNNTEMPGMCTMYIQFKVNGKAVDIYSYKNVPISVYTGLCIAPSKGQYFYQNIRNQFVSELVRSKDKPTYKKA